MSCIELRLRTLTEHLSEWPLPFISEARQTLMNINLSVFDNIPNYLTHRLANWHLCLDGTQQSGNFKFATRLGCDV